MRIRLGLGKELKTIYKRYIYILTAAQKRWGVVLFVFTIIGAICETLGVSVIITTCSGDDSTRTIMKYNIVLKVMSSLTSNSEVVNLVLGGE